MGNDTPPSRTLTPFRVLSARLLALADEYAPTVRELLLGVPKLSLNPRELLSAIRDLAGSVATGALGPTDLDDHDRLKLVRLIALAALALCAVPPPPPSDPPSSEPETVRERGRVA